MDAELLLKRRIVLAEDVFAELVLWRVPRPLPASAHSFKYRLALVAAGVCVLRYDNEAGKGDHKHAGSIETPYPFMDVKTLLKDFQDDIERWISEHRDAEDR